MNFDARGIAQEVAELYESRLHSYKANAENVQTVLQGPVVALTQYILFSSPAQTKHHELNSNGDEHGLPNGAEEKRCCGGEDEGKRGARNALLVQSIVDTFSKDNRDDDAALNLLGRRNKARLEAFLSGVEFAVERSTASSLSLSSSSCSTNSSPPPSPSSFPTTQPKVPNPSKEQQLKDFNRRTSYTKNIIHIANTFIAKKESLESSPVLTSLNNRSKAWLRSVSGEPSLNNTRKKKELQIRTPELQVRLELYVRGLLRVRALHQACVVAYEPNKAIHARARMVVAAFVSTVGCVLTMKPVLTRLLTILTKELLAVETISEALVRVIRRLVNEYEHSISFASLAFLSSPEASAETRLSPLVVRYIHYIQADWKCHEDACELERMLAKSLDGKMRRFLKTIEFQSIGHLLEVCQGFRNELNNIELTPTSPDDTTNCGSSSNFLDSSNNPKAVRQAIRDLKREVITLNGYVLPPVTSRQDLIDLLSQSLNSRSLTAPGCEGRPATLMLPEQKTRSGIYTCNDARNACTENVSSLEGGNHDAEDTIKLPQLQGKGSESSPGLKRRASFHLSMVDLLTRRLLIAASRTGTGGDAYFIVRDLFGGDEVEVVPSKILPYHVRASRVGSIEIQVRLASVTIKCHGGFDIYPKSLVGGCEPLIQLHTTSSETVYLQELRSCDSSSDVGQRQCLEDGSSCGSEGMENLLLQERRTNRTGKRVLAIRPALYEKVQVWNTLS